MSAATDVGPPGPTQQLACNGQAGLPKPGLPTLIQLTNPALDGVLGAILAESASGPLGIVLAGLTYELSTLCGKPQPADPVLTLADLTAAVNPQLDLDASVTAIARIKQWAEFMFWPIWCVCPDNSVPPAAVSAPLPVVGTNPGLPASPSGPTCWDANATISQNDGFAWNFNGSLQQLGDMPGWNPSNGPAAQKLPTPLPSSVFVTITRHSDGGSLADWGASIQFADAAGALLPGGFTTSSSNLPNTPLTFGGAIPTGAVYMSVVATDTRHLFPTDTATGRIQEFCGTNTPSTPQTPCCPPDPSLDYRLRQIEQYEQVIIQLLQRVQPGGSTGWVDGVRHVGLTGASHLDFVGKATGVRAEVTTIPPTVSAIPGDPTFYWDLGFITPLAIDIPLRGQRLVFNPEIFAMPPQATGVSWSLPPGAVVDLVELEPV